MSLEPGRKLGPYEVISMLGAGGMGEVYRARDWRLDRIVALKVLRSGTSDPTAIARFEREARAIAALSHPHICAIHDVGRADQDEYLVMEHLEGETLAERLTRGPLPQSLVLRYGGQIAEALHHAHRAGISHRDLKPGNIMITASGVKLLDFGLARLIEGGPVSGAGADVPTMVAPLTAENTIVGTVQYMSPEQIEGKPLDHRTDIFSLGIVLHEMVSGERPFRGASPAITAAAIVANDAPPLRSVQPATSPNLERIVITALEKNPDDRWQTAHDVARQLRWLSDSSSTSDEPTDARRSRRFSSVLPALLVTGLAAAALTWLLARTLDAPAAQTGPVRLHLVTSPEVTAVTSSDSNSMAISPDGRTLVFAGTSNGARSLFLRKLDSPEFTRIEGSDGAHGPFWSSDGQWVGFSARGTLWKTNIASPAPPVALCEVSRGGATGTWNGPVILFSDSPEGKRGVFRLSQDGGQPQAITTPGEGEWRHSWPQILPDGEHFLYLAYSNRSLHREVILATLDGRKKGVLTTNVSLVCAVARNRLVFVRDGSLLSQEVDVSRAALTGEPVVVAENVEYFYANALAELAVSPAGVIVYRTNTTVARLSVVDRSGKETRLLSDQNIFYDASLSPDGRKAAVTVLSHATGMGDIWLFDLARGVQDRLTNEPGMEFAPVWSVDGKWMLYGYGGGGSVPYIVRRRLTGGPPEPVTQPGPFRYPRSASPDGKHVFIVDRGSSTQTDVQLLSVPDGALTPILSSEFNEGGPEGSPDGKWLAYASDVTGRNEIYLHALSGESSGRIRISSDGGRAPRWSRDGRELFYLGADQRTIHVAHSTTGGWEDAASTPLFTVSARVPDYLVLPGAQSFVVLERAPGPRDSLIHVIAGWK